MEHAPVAEGAQLVRAAKVPANEHSIGHAVLHILSAAHSIAAGADISTSNRRASAFRTTREPIDTNITRTELVRIVTGVTARILQPL